MAQKRSFAQNPTAAQNQQVIDTDKNKQIVEQKLAEDKADKHEVVAPVPENKSETAALMDELKTGTKAGQSKKMTGVYLDPSTLDALDKLRTQSVPRGRKPMNRSELIDKIIVAFLHDIEKMK